ncbi:2-isopropylmalate synthase [Bartonella sp. DGB2]|uniref:2-isopropylmalate synthase n=1 Tax=Bartonella sp. DGB2 TaxID=3388426 RepID=UPI00398F96B6
MKRDTSSFSAHHARMAPRKTMSQAAKKYQPYPPIHLENRQWPNRMINHAPIWCSVDLRDGNQALINPMGQDRKERMFRFLIEMGFPEIEIGFPSASQTDFDFARWCIEKATLPDDLSLQVLVQCRPDLIARTFEALEGARQPIVHFYNSTSTLQRRVVFSKDVAGVKQIAVDAANLVMDMAAKAGNDYRFEYSPESFTGTELEVVLEISNAVIEAINPTPEKKMILNLPSTVEMASVNIYADQIEWMCRNIDRRDSVLISLHTHNDRGTGVAAAELGLMAGADRVEGTLFGNGERTGNVDIVTLALNMFTQGVDPCLDCSNIEEIKEIYEYANQLRISERHPYVGELVYTAFSGSHQDAINKGLKARDTANSPFWEVPYLPIDPQDVGRSYEAIIRVNSQSGKGGLAYVLRQDYGVNIPRSFQVDFRNIIQKVADKEGKTLSSARIYEEFCKAYFISPQARFQFIDYHTAAVVEGKNCRAVSVEIRDGDKNIRLDSMGVGAIDGFIRAFSSYIGEDLRVVDYNEHSLKQGADANLICYMEIAHKENKAFGAAIHSNITTASLMAILAAANHLIANKSIGCA